MLRGGDLYVSAAPDLWKLRDTNGDGVFDAKSRSVTATRIIRPSPATTCPP